MRIRWLFPVVASLLITPAIGQEEDSFDAFDKMLDQQFEKAESVVNARYDAVDKAIDRAFQGLTRKIEVHWGENTRMPSRETWVTYSKDMSSRMSLDFKNSEMVLEKVIPEEADIGQELNSLEQFAGQLMEASREELNEQDSLVEEIRQELEEGGVKTETPDLPVSSVDDNVISKVVETPAVSESLHEMALEHEGSTSASSSQAVTESAEPRLSVENSGGVKTLKVAFPFVSNAQQNIMESHMDEVRQYSQSYDVPVSVILAIIETESSFNPRAVSPIPAFGLMQLVPRTAGVDAYEKVHGEKKVVEPDFLFDEVNNIQLGSAYLNLVRDRYLRKIKNPYSRFYCAIAAYNTGVGNVAKTFTGTTSLNAAARKVNQMSEQEVYDYLLENLPAEETRNYLRKITARIENYKHLDVG